MSQRRQSLAFPGGSGLEWVSDRKHQEAILRSKPTHFLNVSVATLRKDQFTPALLGCPPELPVIGQRFKGLAPTQDLP